MKKLLSLVVILLMIVPIPVQGAKKVTSIESYSQGKGRCCRKRSCT